MRFCVVALLFFLFGILFFAQQRVCGFEKESRKKYGGTVAELILQLGDDDFFVREQAEKDLQQLGLKVVRELQDASLGSDLEIAERAKKLLQLLEINWTDSVDTPPVRSLMQQYAQSDMMQRKIGLIGELSDWSGNRDFLNGEGIHALCRIVRFERDPLVRAEAVRAIIALPPLRYSSRFHWFEKVIETFEGMEDDFLIDLIRSFAQTRNDVIRLREQLLFQPDLSIPTSLIEQVDRLEKSIATFRESRLWSEGRKGTDSDILLFYAIAELQEGLGLNEEVQRTVQGALEVVPVWTEEGLSPYLAHYLVALYLEERNCPKWANREYEMVAQKEPRFKSEVYARIGGNCLPLDEIEKAAESFQIVVETVAHPLNPGNDFFAGNPTFFAMMQQYCLAKIAFQQGNRAGSQQYLEEVFRRDPSFADGLILRHQLGLQQSVRAGLTIEVESEQIGEYRLQTSEMIERTLMNSTRTIEEMRRTRGIDERTSGPLNQLAWILANTGGDYELALKSVEEALLFCPDNPGFLDTLAHVYHLNRENDRAIATESRAIAIAPQIQLFRKALKQFEQRD
ncbi:MAG: hypothetical protein ACRC10_07285 [Thermoguttaceae bacterium]